MPPESTGQVRSIAVELGFTEESLPRRFADGTEVRAVKLQADDALTLDLIPVAPHLQEIWDDRRRVETSEGALWVVSRDGLIRMKTAAGRDQGLADVRRLRDLDS